MLYPCNSLSSWQQPKLELSNYMSFHTSRYRDEYEEVSSLGKGAYGSVYKVNSILLMLTAKFWIIHISTHCVSCIYHPRFIKNSVLKI